MKKVNQLACVFFCLASLILSKNANAQSEPMFSQYTFNEVFINPAYAGSHEALSLSSVYRNQWANLEGSPTTKTVTAHTHLFNSKVGAGVTVYQDQIGVTSQTGFFANYSYRIRLRKGLLSLGLLGGVSGYQERLSEIKTTQGGDAQFLNNTPVAFAPNFGFGAYYYTDRFYFGVSTPRLITNKLVVNSNGSVESVTGSFDRKEVHYFIASGVIIDVNPLFKVRPSFMIKAVMNAPIEYDLNLSALMYNLIWVGGGYRSGDAYSFLTALQLSNQFRMGYSYDYTLTKLKDFSGGTHEVSLNYIFSYNNKKVTSPRYF